MNREEYTMTRNNKSSEDYLETIYLLSQKLPVVRSIDIAAELNFSKPSVSVAMKHLRESNCIILGTKNNNRPKKAAGKASEPNM